MGGNSNDDGKSIIITTFSKILRTTFLLRIHASVVPFVMYPLVETNLLSLAIKYQGIMSSDYCKIVAFALSLAALVISW